MADSPQVQARAFGVRFEQAIDNLKGKLPEASLAWDSLAGPVHGKVFTVAGATSADLAADIQDSLVRALQNGSTITQFRRDFDAAVQSHGWTYNGKRGWRTQVIFSTNMRSAHMAGRWQQIVANAQQRPYLQYRTAGDSRVRPQHRQWNGLVYPVGDAFWRTHYPPNGWGCRCTVRAYGTAELQDKGLQVSQPIAPKVRDVVDAAGQVVDQVPIGIDPGWDHNVGQAWVQPELALGEKLARLPPELRGPVIDKTISPAFQQVLNERWQAFRQAVESPSNAANPAAAADAQAQAQAQIVGFLDSRTVEALARIAPDIELQSTTVAAFDATAARLAGWPADLVATLPEQLRNYRAVLWDRTAQRLVVVPQGGQLTAGAAIPTATLRLNATTDFGAAVSVESLGTARLAELGGTGYTVLVGRLR